MCSSADCRGHAPTRAVRIRALVLLVAVVASLILVAVNGLALGGAGHPPATGDLVFRGDAAAQRRDAAHLLARLPSDNVPGAARRLLEAEAAGLPRATADTSGPLAGASRAARRHFESDMVLARIEIDSGSNSGDVGDARRLLAHGRRGIADLKSEQSAGNA